MYLERSHSLWRRIAATRALDVHFDLGLAAYDRRDAAELKKNRDALVLLPEGGAGSLEFMALEWRMRWLHGAEAEALEIAQRIVALFPEDPDGRLELAQILNDLERPSEAIDVLQAGVERSPEDADLWFELGLASERCERWEARRNAFREVWRLEHGREPEHRLYLTDQQFVAVVEATLEKLPPHARGELGNVAIIVEDYPDEWIVMDDVADPRILGLFDGPTHADATRVSSVPAGPARIYLFRWNIERIAVNQDDAERQIEITVLHEVGHFLGLDEDALQVMGLG